MNIKNQYNFYHASLDNTLQLEGSIFFQIKKVLRLRENDEIVLIDGKGKKGIYKITKISNEYLTLKLSSFSFQNKDKELILIMALLKKDKNELVIQKAVELGATKIFIFQGDNSIPKMKNTVKKLTRWDKIAIEAMEQSSRFYKTEINFFNSLEKALLEAIIFNSNIYLADASTSSSLDSQAKNNSAIIIGAEGGFSESELKVVKKLNINKICLSNNILRAETAAIVSLAQISLLRICAEN